MLCQTALYLCFSALWPTSISAQTDGSDQNDVEIIHECDTTWHFGYNGIKTFTDALQPEFLDRNSEEYKKLSNTIKTHDLQNGWAPDPEQSYYYQHYAHDMAVPAESGREFLNFLTSNSGHKKSLIPELTNLTTCMYILSESPHLKRHTVHASTRRHPHGISRALLRWRA